MILVPRSSAVPVPSFLATVPARLTAVLAVLALALAGLALTAAPAEAGWSRPADLVKYRLCRRGTADGESWVFVSKVRARAGVADSRASIGVYRGNDRVARWRSGWLEQDEVETSRVVARKSSKVRVLVEAEAGDRESVTGTALEAAVLKPKRVRHCG